MSDVFTIGSTTPPEGCEPGRIDIDAGRPNEPIEIVAGDADFTLSATEARELASLLTRAAAFVDSNLHEVHVCRRCGKPRDAEHGSPYLCAFNQNRVEVTAAIIRSRIAEVKNV